MTLRFTCGLRRYAFGIATALTLLLGGCASTDDKVPVSRVEPEGGLVYEVELAGIRSKSELPDLLKKSLRLYTLIERRPGSLARLRRRAESDVATAQKVLRSEGYYSAKVDVVVSEGAPPPPAPEPTRETDDSAEDGSESSGPSSKQVDARAVVNIELGPRYTFDAFSVATPGLDSELALPQPAELGVDVGGPARSETVVAGERAAVRWLRNNGYPFAKYDARRVVVDPARSTVNVSSTLSLGERVRYGALTFSGLEAVDDEYLRTYLPWSSEDFYSLDRVKSLRQAIQGTGLFEVVQLEPIADYASSPGRVPIRATVIESKHRSYGVGLRFSTDEGPQTNAFVEHRNLLGANETVRLSGSVALREQEISLTYRKPQFYRPNQAFFAGLTLRREQDDAFDETAARFIAGIERQVTPRLELSAAVTLEVSSIRDSNRPGTAYLLGFPLTARYDASDNRLDPTRGYRLHAGVTPYVGTFEGESLLFPVVDMGASGYVPLGRHVFAIRGRWASIVGEERDNIPSPNRLYSGGGGSVRGYRSRFIGPLDVEGEPIGGRSAVELGMEVRLRVGESLGLVPFVEAGLVSSNPIPDTDERIQYAAGLGARYYTAIGPIRADIGVPLNRRDEDDIFQLYVSIGQAF